MTRHTSSRDWVILESAGNLCFHFKVIALLTIEKGIANKQPQSPSKLLRYIHHLQTRSLFFFGAMHGIKLFDILIFFSV